MRVTPQQARFGTWKSPIDSDLIVSRTVGLLEPVTLDDDTYWLEMRPEENGRHVIVHSGTGRETSDIIQSPFNARSRVHEYGGASYIVGQNAIFFSNFSDQRVYRLQRNGQTAPIAITNGDSYRYADFVIDDGRERLICIREDHGGSGREPINSVVCIDVREDSNDGGYTLVGGSNFYSSPRLSSDGQYLAWVSWDHPDMPWDSSGLWVAELNAEGVPVEQTLVAGGTNESILQPEWAPDGGLYFLSDRSGWWNLYRWVKGRVEPVVEIEAEIGDPPWTFGRSNYAFESETKAVVAYKSNGLSHLVRVNTKTRELEKIEMPYTEISYLSASSDRVVFLGSSPTDHPSIIELQLTTRKFQVLRCASDIDLDPGYISIPEEIEFPTERNVTAHGFFYAPRNQDYVAPIDERPPLIVLIHGGPTASSSSGLSFGLQYWTSRGFAVLDVNYGGSSGFGRAYRQRLNGLWGVVDVDDCVNGARYLANNGVVDKDRLAIRGSSAGGYTTLSALTFRNVFKVGASHYGVSDLEALSKETHKFESHYIDRLIGPYPEKKELYEQRSPINALEQLSCPVIFFQGLEDKVVPPNQAEKIVEALRKKGLPVAYLVFSEEQHGFRSAKTIKRVLEAELYFYSRVFGFDLAEPVEPVPIDNL